MRTMNVIDGEGMFCTQGLQPPEVCDQAAQAAQEIANDRGEAVWLIGSDYDGSDPWRDGERFDPEAE
jgi:hypothetical protein